MLVPAGSGMDSLSSFKGHDGSKGDEKKRFVIRLSVLLNIILICVIVFAVVPYLNSLLRGESSNGGWFLIPPGKSTAETITERVAECVSENPILSEEQCWDLRYHDTAISHGNSTLCGEIRNDQIRTHCKAYFNE